MRRKITNKHFILLSVFIFLFWGFGVSANNPETIHSASELDYPPFAVTTDDGNASGFSVDLLKEVLNKKGHEVDFYVAPWSDIKSDLENGEIDVLPLVGRTPEREEVFDFTVPYISIYGDVFIRSGLTDINNVWDLKGKEVVVMQDDNAHEYVLRENLSENIITTKNYSEAFTLLSSGKHDAIICLETIGNEIIQDLGIKNVHAISKINNYKQDFTFAVQEGNSDLLATLNDGLSQVISDGTYDSIYKKWFEGRKEKFTENINYQAEAKIIAMEIGDFLNDIVQDAQYVASLDFSNTESAKQKIAEFYNSKQKGIWFNIGSDQSVISQTMTIPLYKEISVTDENGQELIKYSEGKFIEDLKDISDTQNTKYKSEKYWENTKNTEEGKVHLGRVYTDYTPKEKVFSSLDQEFFNKYEKVIARDIMKQGHINLSAPIYNDGAFKGIVNLSLDYRHLQDLVKHIEPGNQNKVISASYEKNYILFYDHEGDTIVHPKPDNIRGYLPDGKLAGYNEENPKNEGSIFNLFAYQKSKTYPEMANKTLVEKDVYTSSAVDVSGRTKLTVAVPVIFDNPNTNYSDIGIFGGIMLSVSLNNSADKDLKKTSAKLKALETAEEIDNFLIANPDKTISDLQEDSFFKNIAIQQVTESGYTMVMDSDNGTFYFHPQEELIGKNYNDLKDKAPDWWNIIDSAIGAKCQESEGEYDWTEIDETVTKKYMYVVCAEKASADQKNLIVIATTYQSSDDAEKYVNKYEISKNFNFARSSIRQRALDISKQVEIYLKSNPGLSLEDLKNDPLFHEIAVQTIGDTGYTYLVTHNNGFIDFHIDPKIEGKSYNSFKETFPLIWEILNDSLTADNCKDSEGYYAWEDINGNVRDKYTYHHCIETPTADGYRFFIGASTYLDEYQLESSLPSPTTDPTTIDEYTWLFSYFFVAIVLSILVICFLIYFKLIKIQGAYLYILLGVSFLIVSGLFILGSYITVKNLKLFLEDTYISQQYQIVSIKKDRIIEEFQRLSLELSHLAEEIKSSTANLRESSLYLQEAKERSRDYVYATYRIDKDSTIRNMYPIDQSSLGADLSEQAHMLKIKSTQAPVASNVFDAVEGFRAITIQYPVIVNEIYDGTVALLVDLDSLFQDINIFKHNKNSYQSYLLDSNNSIILSENSENLGEDFNVVGVFGENRDLIDKMKKSTGVEHFEFTTDNKQYIAVFSPIKIEDNTWHLVQTSSEGNIHGSTNSALNKIWLYTFFTLLILALLGFVASYLLTTSLKREIELRTKEVREKALQIREQLQREAEVNQVNKRLLKEQKKSKIELEEKINELESFQKIIINRELKMIELKEKIAKLQQIIDKNSK